MNNKENILEDLVTIRSSMDVVIEAFKYVDSLDLKEKRISTNTVTINLFDAIDLLTKTEVDIYNYLRSLD